MEARLKTSLIVGAEIRRCENMSMSATVNHKGDADRGLLLIKQYVYGQGCKIYTQSRDMDGTLFWQQPKGEAFIEERDADHYIARQIDFDPDLWVLEIEDNKCEYSPPK